VKKTCTKCGLSLPLSEFRPRAKKENGCIYRYVNPTCRECDRSYARARPSASKRQADLKWRTEHPEDYRKSNLASMAKKRDSGRARELWQSWFERNREYVNSKQAERRKADPEKFNAKRRAKYAIDPEPALAHARRRRARINGGDLSLAQWLKIVADFGEKCAYCGGLYEEMDHVLPLSRGGRHEAGNVVPACVPCNRSKKDKTFTEWIGCGERVCG
jgi:5-methylcytosine-specific restriction endonuclease McrA